MSEISQEDLKAINGGYLVDKYKEIEEYSSYCIDEYTSLVIDKYPSPVRAAKFSAGKARDFETKSSLGKVAAK